jgi:isopentenyl diphosphate isomerase/L-lactate dehydrogenase-like FMN-dependent dehydrogenase
MKKNQFYSSFDFIVSAKKNLPKFVFDFIDGGAGKEDALDLNVASFQKKKLISFIMDENFSSNFSLNSGVLGLNYSAPFGVAPLGLCGLVHPNADITLSKVAAKYNVPYVISAASNISIEAITQASGVSPWFQLYIPKVEAQLDLLLSKAEASHCPVLVVTVDASVPGRRLRDLHNGLKLPYKLNYSNVIEVVKHPRWAMDRLLAGKITFPNFTDMENENKDLTFSDLMLLQTGGNLNWNVISKIRQRWKNKMILKGVLSVADAVRAQRLGVNAVIISNHGGRQLNLAPAPISVLPHFVNVGLKKEFLMLDSGVRTGDNIVTSLACGAGFVFMGRAFLYALAANGEQGVEKLFEIIFEELTVNLKLLGVNSPDEVSARNCYVG